MTFCGSTPFEWARSASDCPDCGAVGGLEGVTPMVGAAPDRLPAGPPGR